MDKEKNLLVDVISILPNEIDLFINAPSLEDEMILRMWNATIEYDFDNVIKINNTNKEIFLNRIKSYSIAGELHAIQIRQNGKLLFESWDGIECGVLSNTLLIPDWFKEKYIQNEDCEISDSW